MKRGTAARLDPQYERLNLRKLAYYSNPRYPLVPLGTLATFIQYGISERANTSELGVPMIRMSNLQANGWDFSNLKHIELNAADLERYRLYKGDLLFNRTNSKELVGKCEAFAEDGNWVFASYLIRVRLNIKRAIPGFVSAFLNSPAGRIQIDQVSRQVAGMSNVNAEELRELLIPLPDVEEQKRLLGEISAAQEARDRALKEAEGISKNLDKEIAALLGLQPLPSDLVRTYAVRLSTVSAARFDVAYQNPRYAEAERALLAAKGERVRLGELVIDIAGGATPKAKDDSLYTNTGIRFLRILNVKPNRLDFSDLNYIQEEVHKGPLKRSQLEVGDVLMTITGRVGTAAVVTERDLPANINQHIVRLRIDGSRCLPDYLAAYLNTSLGMLLSNRSVSGGTRVALDYGAISQIPILLPSRTVQKHIIELVRMARITEESLRSHAWAAWQQARERFEQQVLHGESK